MPELFPRFLLALSGLILLLGGLMHARAFDRALAALAASNLDAFFANSLRALWLIDSATLITLGVLFGAASARPQLLSRFALFLLALVPGATCTFQYRFLGNFLPAHMLLTATLAALLAAAMSGFDNKAMSRQDA